MSKKRSKKKCKYCRELFPLNKKIQKDQEACSKEVCQQLRKKKNNKTFKKNNPDYWEGRYEYIKEYRKRNPDYQKKWYQQKGKTAKQAEEDQEGKKQKVASLIDSINKNLAILHEKQAEIFIAPPLNKVEGSNIRRS